jgi:molecular chaperone DnaK
MAKDMATGKDQKITITANSGLNDEQISKMVKEAAEHEAEDKRRREEVERRNKLDNLCYTLERQIADNKEKLQGTDLGRIESLIKDGREAVEKQDDEKVQRVLQDLEKEAHAMASKLYEAAGSGGPSAGNGAEPGGNAGAAGGGGDKKKGGDVIDAEFEESN